MALAGGGMAHTGGAKTRARVLFLKSTPKTWFLSSFPLATQNLHKGAGGFVNAVQVKQFS